ncbi:hypothetical protein C8R44DRAFT_771774 [Mycena epipterygia]|nr:hypothetical protein C8R44DRAFT_771774 [Mycena epipterygia]
MSIMSAVRSFLVTGSNQGLGMHTVHQLAMTPEALVFMGSRKLAAAEEALAKFAPEIHASSTVVPVQLDVTDAESIKSAQAFIKEYLQGKSIAGLDVLINNAGIAGTSLETAYAVNVFGAANVTAAVRPLMNNGGAIINVTSRMGSLSWFMSPTPPTMLHIPYATSKSALNALTVNWALEEKNKGSGIRVVSICPGFNATRINGFSGTTSPAEGCKLVVNEALAKEGRTGVFYNKGGDLAW